MLSQKLTIKDSLLFTYLIWNTLPKIMADKVKAAEEVATNFFKCEENFVHSCPACSYAIQQTRDVPFDVAPRVTMSANYCRHCTLRTLWFLFVDDDPWAPGPCETIERSPYSKWQELTLDAIAGHPHIYDIHFFALMIAEEALSEYHRLGGSLYLSEQCES